MTAIVLERIVDPAIEHAGVGKQVSEAGMVLII